MRMIGFPTGALARGDYRQALGMLADKELNAVELSNYQRFDRKNSSRWSRTSTISICANSGISAPSSLDSVFEVTAIQLLERVAARGWPDICSWTMMGTCPALPE